MDEFPALFPFQRSYKNELKLCICDSRHRLKMHLSGQGLEARLEFSPPALKMEWVLVNSAGVDTTVVVKNPCNFPVEFSSLDFDEQYLEEEKVRGRSGPHRHAAQASQHSSIPRLVPGRWRQSPGQSQLC